MTWPPDYMKNVLAATYGMWNSPTPGLTLGGQVQPGEGGVDIGTPIGTPVYALATGPIIAAGYWKDNAHGVITQRVNVPGAGLQDLYYQHIQLDPSIQQCQGTCTQVVQQGQKIGTIGPFNEIEMGFNSAWGGVWGTNHPGPWIRDPRQWIWALATGNPAPVGSTSNSSASGASSFNPLDPTSYLPTLKSWGEYVAIFILAVLFVGVGIYLLGGNPMAPIQAPLNYVQQRRNTLKAGA
jgi:peptidase M23-like protein